jgi:hypothetical protein
MDEHRTNQIQKLLESNLQQFNFKIKELTKTLNSVQSTLKKEKLRHLYLHKI